MRECGCVCVVRPVYLRNSEWRCFVDKREMGQREEIKF